MARPRQTSSEDMLRILNSYWETHGDPNKLKCSLLEKYAASIGFDIKAFSFRRDDLVRIRINELQAGGAFVLGALTYKNLDIEKFIANHATKPALTAALAELDAYWRDIYGRAVELSNDNVKLLSDNAALRAAITENTSDLNTKTDDLRKASSENNSLVAENRYLRSVLARYLYPAVANEILYREGVIKETGTEVADVAISELSEPSTPIPFSRAVEHDAQMLSREQLLIERMKQQIGSNGEDD